MQTYLILKEKAKKFNQDAEIQELLAEIKADHGSMARFLGKYTPENVAALKAQAFDRPVMGARGLKYERLDQLTVEHLLGIR